LLSAGLSFYGLLLAQVAGPMLRPRFSVRAMPAMLFGALPLLR
jgi:hypothetical protein